MSPFLFIKCEHVRCRKQTSQFHKIFLIKAVYLTRVVINFMARKHLFTSYQSLPKLPQLQEEEKGITDTETRSLQPHNHKITKCTKAGSGSWPRVCHWIKTYLRSVTSKPAGVGVGGGPKQIQYNPLHCTSLNTSSWYSTLCYHIPTFPVAFCLFYLLPSEKKIYWTIKCLIFRHIFYLR